VSVRDMVRAQAALVESLGMRRLRLVVGGSLGGMQVLEWALLFPGRVDAIAPIAVSARQSAWRIGLSEAQRQAIFADPRWCGGRYPASDPPERGLAAARMVALCAGGGRASLEGLLDRSRPGERAVTGWLHDRGQSFADRFDAGAYVALTRAMDTHDVGRGRSGWRAALATVGVPALVVSIDDDGLHAPGEVDELADALPAGRRSILRSHYGHEAFLIEGEATNALLAEFRAEAALPRRPAEARVSRGLELRYAG
jgi:homoserine O-acetyltransferase